MNYILFRILIGSTYKNYRIKDLLSKEVFTEYNEISLKNNKTHKFIVSEMNCDNGSFEINSKIVNKKEYILHALSFERDLYNRDIANIFFHYNTLDNKVKKEIIQEFIFANFEFFDRLNEFLYIAVHYKEFSDRLQAEPLYHVMQDILPDINKESIFSEHEYEYRNNKTYNPDDKHLFLKQTIYHTYLLANSTNHLIRYVYSIKNESEFVHDVISFIFGHVYTNHKNQDIIKSSATPVILSKEREEPYMFTIGNETIEKMNLIKVEIKTDNLDQMSKIIGTLKSSIDRYKKFSNLGFFRRMFSNKLEIQANITISIINFENSLDSGHDIRNKLQKQYDSFQNSVDQLKNIFNEFTKNLEELNDYIENKEISIHERDRLLRRKTDLSAAQLLCANSAAQFELSMSNTITLIDKFTTIEQILKPVITQNMQLTKEMQRILK